MYLNTNTQKSKEQQIKNNLQEYKDWLFNLKILDPACGSGAFLNQALEFLITNMVRFTHEKRPPFPAAVKCDIGLTRQKVL